MTGVSSLRLYHAVIPFRTTFRHGAAERSATETIFVEAGDGMGDTGYGEACPRIYVTGESIQSCREFFRSHYDGIIGIGNLEGLIAYTRVHRDSININPAAWCAIEMAMLDLIAKQSRTPVESLLDQHNPASSYRYTAVIGDCSPRAFQKLYQTYRQRGFTDFKIKLSADPQQDREKLACMRDDTDQIHVRADANNLWPSVETALTSIRETEFDFYALEEPLRSRDVGELRRLHDEIDLPIILDESFLNETHLGPISSRPAAWIVNVRVSKFGGILRSLDLVDKLIAAGINIIVGAQVGESSLLTRSALIIADRAGVCLQAQEGAFSELLLESDPFLPRLQFDAGGILAGPVLSCRRDPGLGLEPLATLGGIPGITELDDSPV